MAYRFRGRGRLTSPTSRSGRGYVYSGRSVQIRGEKFQLTWNGPQVMAELFEALSDAFATISDSALSYMQSIVPVDTGRLRDSCFVQIEEQLGRITVIIGADTPYAVYVELGTSSRPAQPYIRPTFDYVMSILPAVVRNEVRRRGR